MNELYPLQKKATYNALQPGSVPNYNITFDFMSLG